MIADEDGRWASAGNAAAFGAFVARLLDALRRFGAWPRRRSCSIRADRGGAAGARRGARRARSARRWAAGSAGEPAVGRGAARTRSWRARCTRGVATLGRDRAARFDRRAGTRLGAAARDASVRAAVGGASARCCTRRCSRGTPRGALGREDAVTLLACGVLAPPPGGSVRGRVPRWARGQRRARRRAGLPLGRRAPREDVAAAAAAGVSDLVAVRPRRGAARPPAEAWHRRWSRRREAAFAPGDAQGARRDRGRQRSSVERRATLAGSPRLDGDHP